jgi:hypothetical protein
MELMCAILRLFWTTRHVPVLVFTFALHKSLTHYIVLKLLSSGMLYFVEYQTTRCHVPENSIFNIHRLEKPSLITFWDFRFYAASDKRFQLLTNPWKHSGQYNLPPAIIFKQERPFTLRRVCVTIVGVKSTKYYLFWVCTCSLRYPACNASAPFFHPRSVRLHSILPHYFIKGTM